MLCQDKVEMGLWLPEGEEGGFSPVMEECPSLFFPQVFRKIYKVVKCLKRMESILKDASAGSGCQLIGTLGIFETFPKNSQPWGETQAAELSGAPRGTPKCRHIGNHLVQVMSLQRPDR